MNLLKKNFEVDMSLIVFVIMGELIFNFNIKVLKFGREFELFVKIIYCNMYKDNYVNVKFRECGIFLYYEFFYLVVSFDMLVLCDCCGEGFLEVKLILKLKCDLCLLFCLCNLLDYFLFIDGEMDIKKNYCYFC